MRKAKLISIIILIALVLVTLILASSAAEGDDAPENTTPPPAESQQPTDHERPQITGAVFLRDQGSSLYASGAQVYAKDLRNLTLEVYYADGSEQEQLDDVKRFIAEHGETGVFLIEPVTSAVLRTIAPLAEEAGVYWSSIGEAAARLYPMDYDYYTVYQGVDQQEAGYNAAETLFSHMDEIGTNYIIVLDGAEDTSAMYDRQYGLNKALGERLDIVVKQRTTAADRETAEAVVEQWLAEYGDVIVGIWCANDELALGARDAVQKLGSNGAEIHIMGIQPSEESLEQIVAGQMESIYTYERMQGAYGLAVPYLAAVGEADVASLSSAQRYFYVPQVAISSKNAEAVLSRINSVDLLYAGNWMGEAIEIPV